ncbi:MAG: DUF2961 domain-containing protein, partial [Bryobacteraceae bacterium]
TDPDTEWVLFEADGPGVITSIWMTGKNKKGEPYIGGRLNFYFDGEPKASFSERIPELFESGRPWPPPLAERSRGAWISYVPIYYAKKLKITLSDHRDAFTHRKNGRGETIPHIYHQFSYQKLPRPVRSLRPHEARFASWRPDLRGRLGERRVRVPAGAEVELLAAAGRGILNELRIRWLEGEADSTRIRVLADGRATVDMLVREFWGFSRSERPHARMQSLLLGVEDDGAYYCRFPMPFRESLRVVLKSQTPSVVHVHTRLFRGWFAREHFYFRANRVSDVAAPWRDLTVLKAAGRGHFVGVVLEVPREAMEGDERFYVDGESFPPAWHGTGTEDYFRCGWYFHGGPVSRPLYGLLDDGEPRIAYRFHVADRVNFTRSVLIGFEHGHRNEYRGPYSGTVYWYSEHNR